MALKQLPALNSNSGFTYIGLLILIAIMGVMLATIGTFWHTTQQRFREKQLLFIGNQFSQAITAYHQNTPGTAKQYPKKLEDLLADKRYPITARYLRKIFADPITGSTEWGLIKGADGGIAGVYSLSDMEPIKKDNFGKGNATFANKKHYSDWRFVINANGNLLLVSSATPGNGANGGSPANSVPPAYQVPSPDPLPSDPTPEDTNLQQCQIMRSSDATICARQAVLFGDAAGLACMASANQRYAICINPGHGMLPSLVIKYK